MSDDYIEREYEEINVYMQIWEQEADKVIAKLRLEHPNFDEDDDEWTELVFQALRDAGL